MPRTKAGTPLGIPRHITLDPDIDKALSEYLKEHPGQSLSEIVRVSLRWFLSVEE